MARQTSMWGPELGQYSHNFDPHLLPDMPNREIANFYNEHKVLPLTSIHNSLCRSDPRIDELGFTRMKLGHVLEGLRKYMVVSRSTNVFKNYYGFLCVRNLVHINCLTILRETNTLGRVIGSLRPNASWNDMSQALAFVALDRATGATRDVTSLENFSGMFTRPGFAFDHTTGEANMSMLARMLWEGRDSFLTLCSLGLLPGCALLLLAVLKLLPTGSKEGKDVLYLQDLGFRLYLVGSRRDQQVLPPVCLFVDEKNIAWPTNTIQFLNPEDSRTIARAYSGLFLLWQQDKSSARSVSIGLMGHLAGFVLHMFGGNPSATPQELMHVASVSLQLLWMLLEPRGRLPVTEHPQVREYANLSFVTLKFILDHHLSTQDEQYSFAKMIADNEIVSLAGRVLLLTIDEGNEFQNTECFDLVLETLIESKGAFTLATSIAPELFYDSSIEWHKVMAHLVQPVEMGIVDFKDKHSDATRDMFGCRWSGDVCAPSLHLAESTLYVWEM
ncbi:hypothetical protein FS749_016460 [Ceratobasidium sp. UAMH 11750]|nr:hypothetical protein FS749_016460 [Ceratobasidium sp. UAMH 11750]